MLSLYADEHGQHGLVDDEGDLWLEMIQANQLTAVNNKSFKKVKAHLTTHKSGNNAMQVDYIMVYNRRNVQNAKVFPNEAVTRQHRLLVGDISCSAERTRRKGREFQGLKYGS